MSTIPNYIVDSPWNRTARFNLTNGTNSWVWVAKVTFTVLEPYPAVVYLTDADFPSNLVAIYDGTGTKVSAMAACWGW